MIRDWRANYNNPEISDYDKSTFWRVGEEEQPDQQEKRGGD